MVRINLETTIAAPIERVFDVARSIDLHVASTDFTGEEAIAGVISGNRVGRADHVEGSSLRPEDRHTSLSTAYHFPIYFQDSMIRDLFRAFRHDHFFEKTANGTLMKDALEFEAPYDALGRVVERILLAKHLRQLLLRRNQHIKRVAESDEWKHYLSIPVH
jgi:ligand-binding SRPBCC domain-containing protein